MSRESMPLQELQSSTMSQSRRGSKRKHRSLLSEGLDCEFRSRSLLSEGLDSEFRSRSLLAEGLDNECTPTDLIQQWSPSHKHQRLLSMEKENEENMFVLARRPRRKKGPITAGISWDHLPEELLLRILFYLPLQDLLRTSRVCKRWHRLALDESLWVSVDLEGLTHTGSAMQQVLNTGVRRLRCPRSFVEETKFTVTSPLQIVQLDLSSSIMPTPALESIICSCTQLEYLSLEGLQLSDNIISSLSKNTKLRQLNLSGCTGFSASPLADMLKSCCRIEQLNISWCDFDNNHVKSVVENLSSTLTQLNISGYRESLTLDDVKVLVTRCPCLRTLDLSDSTLLMADIFAVLKDLKYLIHLSLSRCYHIHLATIYTLGEVFPMLSLLEVFGLVQDSQLSSLKGGLPHISINTRPFSTVARPTPACRSIILGDRAMWSRRCRLRVKL